MWSGRWRGRLHAENIQGINPVIRRSLLSLAAATFLLLGAEPRVLAAQTLSQLAAFDGLMLSPIGALSPFVHDPLDAGKPGDEFGFRYGRWRYDVDDAVHDNVGLTWARRFTFARTEVALTGAYAAVECGTCSGWVMGGLSVRSTVVERVAAAERESTWRASAGMQLDIGGARYRGVERASTTSASITLPVEVVAPLRWTNSIGVAVLPGFGYGNISSTDVSQSGVVPMVGGSLMWAITSRVVLGVGVQRLIIPNGTTQVGASFLWDTRAENAPKP